MLYIYMTKCYSAIEKNKIMKFTEKWMKLETITISEATYSQKINTYFLSYMGISFQYSDMCISFVIFIEIRKLMRGYRGQWDLFRDGT